jgi:hypothetical protein
MKTRCGVSLAIAMFLAMSSHAQLLMRVDKIQRAAPPAAEAEEIAKLKGKVTGEADPEKKARLEKQLARLEAKAQDASDFMVFGVAEDEAKPDVPARPIVVQAPNRLGTLKRVSSGEFIQFDTVSHTEWGSTATGKKVVKVQQPKWWRNDDLVSRPWDSADEKETVRSGLVFVSIGEPEIVLGQPQQHVGTAFGSMRVGGSADGLRFPIVIKASESIVGARLVVDLLDADGDVIFTHCVSVGPLDVGKQQTIHVFLPDGVTHDRVANAQVGVAAVKMRPPTTQPGTP